MCVTVLEVMKYVCMLTLFCGLLMVSHDIVSTNSVRYKVTYGKAGCDRSMTLREC